MRKTFKTKWDFGDQVVLKTDPDKERIVSGFLIRPKGITIGLIRGDEETWHQELEITSAFKPFKVKGFKG